MPDPVVASTQLQCAKLPDPFACPSAPLLAQLFLVYYGSGQFRPFFQSIGLWWLFRDASSPWRASTW